MGFAGSTQNDGYIGDYFGCWVFDSITIDGEPEPGYDGNLMIAFQSSIFQMDLVLNDLVIDDEGKFVPQGGQMIMGIWDEKGSALTFRGDPKQCNHFVDPAGDRLPCFPDMSGFGTGVDGDLTATVTIEKKSGDRMVWTRTDDQGRLWRYSLKHIL